MLVRRRLSRIFYRRRFFDYPLTLNADTLKNLGLMEALQIGLSYGHAQLKSRSPQVTLEDFLINRFGDRLYRTFFKNYTEKVWGVPCREISAEWGAQRIKGLSVAKALAHALASPFRSSADTAQKQTETSLIERFLYPKLGPGQMWEEVARRVEERGGQVHLRQRIVGIVHDGPTSRRSMWWTNHGIAAARCLRPFHFQHAGQDLVALLQPEDSQVERIAGQLPYRDFMTVGLLLRRMTSSTDRRDPGRPTACRRTIGSTFRSRT